MPTIAKSNLFLQQRPPCEMSEHFEDKLFSQWSHNLKNMKEKEEKKKIDWSIYNSKKFKKYFRLNKNESVKFDELYKFSNEKGEQEFIKKCIFFGGSNYKEVEETNKILIKNNQDIRNNLNKIGTNINQIAMKLNLLKEFPSEEKELLIKEIEELKLLIYDKILRK